MCRGALHSCSPHPRLVPPRSLRSSSSKLAQLTLEQILEHLDNLRLNLTNTKQNCTAARPAPLEPGAGGRGGRALRPRPGG